MKIKLLNEAFVPKIVLSTIKAINNCEWLYPSIPALSQAIMIYKTLEKGALSMEPFDPGPHKKYNTPKGSCVASLI